MSNEELAVLVQNGEQDKLMELWGQVRRMALKEAVRWAAYRSNGAELEDLEQAGFIALMRAVDGFDPTAGARFGTWYYPIMKDEFRRATGRRTAKQAQDPLHTAGSLDIQIGEEDNVATVGELVPDPVAAQAFSDVEDREWLAQLRPILDRALSILPDRQRDTLVQRYYQGQAIAEIAVAEGVSRSTVYSWHDKG